MQNCTLNLEEIVCVSILGTTVVRTAAGTRRFLSLVELQRAKCIDIIGKTKHGSVLVFGN